MKTLSRKFQLEISIGLFLALLAAVTLISFEGDYPSYRISTIVVVVSGIWLFLNRPLLSFEGLIFVIIFIPSFTPIYAWDIFGKQLFSLAAKHLQYDEVLINKATYLYSISAVSYVVVAVPEYSKNSGGKDSNKSLNIGYLPIHFLFFVAFLTVAAAYLLENGPTILTASYKTIKSVQMEKTPLFVFATTAFGGFWSILFLFGRHHKKLFWITTSTILAWLFLHSRRIEVFGIALMLLLWSRYRVNVKYLVIMLILFLFVQGAVGLLRHSPIAVLNSSFALSPAASKRAAIPGGISNVFLSGLHLVNEKDNGMLTFAQTYTMLEWPKALVPNQILHFFNLSSIQKEHDLIYARLELDYVGGMPLLMAFYLNGGVMMVLVFGLLHGYISKRIERIIRRDLGGHLDKGGTWALFITTVFIIYQFRYHWYNPHIPLRAIEFSCVILLGMSIFIKHKKERSL